MRFAHRWNTRTVERDVQLSTPLSPDPFHGNKDTTLDDIMTWWYGDKKKSFTCFHTTDRSVIEILTENLTKSKHRDLRGSGLLGDGFYLTPNARLAFLYGVRSNTPRVFRERWVFAVLQCVLSRQNARKLQYGVDFYFHDLTTMGTLGCPLNGNDLMCREIVLKTATALNSLSLHRVMIVAGAPYGHSARDNVFASFSSIFKNYPAPSPAPQALKGHRVYDEFLKDVQMENIPGFGMIYRIHRYARFIIFDGTIDTFLRSIRESSVYTAILQKIICEFGSTARIHFNRFSPDNRHTSAARCFIIEGHVVQYDPYKFFDTVDRRERKSPLTIMSTSKKTHRPLLIIPPFSLDEKYHNIYTFACRSSPSEFHSFFDYAGNIINRSLSRSSSSPSSLGSRDEEAIQAFWSERHGVDQGVFVNFHGGSVGWLHLRIDIYPAYYALDEYVILEYATLPPLRVMTQYSEMAVVKEELQRRQRQSRRNRIVGLFSKAIPLTKSD